MNDALEDKRTVYLTFEPKDNIFHNKFIKKKMTLLY